MGTELFWSCRCGTHSATRTKGKNDVGVSRNSEPFISVASWLFMMAGLRRCRGCGEHSAIVYDGSHWGDKSAFPHRLDSEYEHSIEVFKATINEMSKAGRHIPRKYRGLIE